MDSWIPDDDNKKNIEALLAEEKEVRPAFSANCVKCGAYTPEDPELRGWWPAINGKLCAESSEPSVYPSEVLTWYCKQCYIEKNGSFLNRLIRKLLRRD